MKRLNYIPLIFLIVFATGCKKFVEVPNPPEKIISDEVFTDDSKANSAVNGIYGSMINGPIGFANSLSSIFTGYSSDELGKFNPTVVDQEFTSNELNPNNSTVQTLWASIYQHIYYTNACLEGLQESNGVSESVRKQLEGECKFLRAFCYFHLVNLYGDVPLVTTTDYRINAALPRAPMAEVYQFIITDLAEAKNLLPVNYITTEKVRPNKWAATAMLARVYLYMQDWAKAETEAGEVINSGVYLPLPPLQSAFLKNSKEAIWQLLPKNGFVPEVNQIVPGGSVPRVIISNQVLQSFQSGDQRRTKWMDSVTYLSNKYYYPGKYKAVTANNAEYYMVLRLAEQFLIRAEARAHLNNISGAISDINLIRTRAGLPGISTILNQTDVLLATERERQNELFAEWGHRWFDLKRTNRATQILSALKTGWQPTDALYPIPLNEILTNPSLQQNPGY